MRKLALLVILGSFHGARAADFCSSSPLNAAQRTVCANEEADRAEARVFDAYQRALAAAKAAKEECGLAVDVEATQDLWKRWNDKECALESAAVPESAAGVTAAICRQRLANDQSKAMSDVADHLRCKAGQTP